MSEKREELERELSEEADKAHMWKSFMEHPGWEMFKAFMQEQQALRASVVMLTPISNDNTTHAQEYFKGEYAGIGLSLSAPETQFEMADIKRKALLKQLENEDELEARVEADVSGRLDGDPFVG